MFADAAFSSVYAAVVGLAVHYEGSGSVPDSANFSKGFSKT